MPRTVSAAFLEEIFKPESGTGIAVLLTITHPDYVGTFRVANNHNQRLSDIPWQYGLISRGNTFVFHPMQQVTIPDDIDEREATSRLVIDNINREFVDFVTTMEGPAQCDIEVVSMAEINTVQMSFLQLDMRSVVGNDTTLTFEFGDDAYEREAFPKGKVTPSQFPGSFPSSR